MRHSAAVAALFILTLIASSVYAEYPVTPRPFPYEDIVYKEPKVSGKTYDFRRTLTIRNEGNTLAYLTSLSGSTSNLGGTTLTVSPNYVGIPANDSRKVDIIFHVPPTLAEGRHEGMVDITSASGVVAEDIILELVITYPPPRVVTEWEYDDDVQDLKVRAGDSYADYVYVSEYYGYKSVSGVNLTLTCEGVANVSYEGELGNISAGTTKIVGVNITIPEKGLVPGVYEMVPSVKAVETITRDLKNGRYIIPDPMLSLNATKIDFGRITFEVGKDTANASLEIKEVGGYTPIEGLNVSISSGEPGWLSYPKDDYVPRNGSVEYSFVVFLPVDASLGQKEWTLEADAPFVASQKALATVIVYFPGIDAAILELQNLTLAKAGALNDSAALADSSIRLLQVARDKVEIRNVAMAMSIYSGTKTLLTKLDAALYALEEGDLATAGKEAIRARSSLNKIKIGDENLGDEALKGHSSVAVGSAESLWDDIAKEVRTALETKGAEIEAEDYKSAALYYKQASEIYTLEKRPLKAEEYAGRQRELEERYQNALDAATDRKFDADERLEESRGGMINLLGGYLILNPFSYESISGSYRHVMSEYSAAEELYTKAGELKNSESVREGLEGIRREWRNIYLAFLIYGSVLTLLSVVSLGRITLGIQRYNEDEQNEHMGELFVQKGG